MRAHEWHTEGSYKQRGLYIEVSFVLSPQVVLLAPSSQREFALGKLRFPVGD